MYVTSLQSCTLYGPNAKMAAGLIFHYFIMYSFEFCMKNEASHANFNLNNRAVIFAFGLYLVPSFNLAAP